MKTEEIINQINNTTKSSEAIKFDKERAESVQDCCESLKRFFENNPKLRFWQGIEIIKSLKYNNKDIFFEEPQETLKILNDL
jgi:hypothetical protein